MLPFPQVSITLANNLKDSALPDLAELIAEDSPVSHSQRASLLSMEASVAEAVAEAAGEAVVEETSEVKTIMASEAAVVLAGEGEDLVAKVALEVRATNYHTSFFLFPGHWNEAPEAAQQGFDNFDE